ncbi:MAG TPA: class I SAM-dependent methyltransferase [Burkholderiaceae bacterium]|jgi:SAM-dependent methyltransferase|nr:class I SAM-dependent methyltransferase [Burkholderiaceae bacterium]
MHDGAPSEWILKWCARLAPESEVLDLACGSGRHSRALAAQGCRVDAVDVDASHAADLAGVAGVQFRAIDLERGPWPFQERQYDAVVVANYLHRPTLPLLAQVLRDGGVLVYETFAAGNERFGRPSNPAFLLAPFELAACFAPLLHVLAFEDGCVGPPRPARVQRLCAIRTESSRLDRLLLPQVR